MCKAGCVIPPIQTTCVNLVWVPGRKEVQAEGTARSGVQRLGCTWTHAFWVAWGARLPTLQALKAEGAVLHRQADGTVRPVANDDHRVPRHGRPLTLAKAQHTLLGNCSAGPCEWVWPRGVGGGMAGRGGTRGSSPKSGAGCLRGGPG